LTVTSPTTTADSAQAPGFSLADQNGHAVALAEALARGPVVLVFYRGYW
jgi:peroxiredoxin